MDCQFALLCICCSIVLKFCHPWERFIIIFHLIYKLLHHYNILVQLTLLIWPLKIIGKKSREISKYCRGKILVDKCKESTFNFVEIVKIF